MRSCMIVFSLFCSRKLSYQNLISLTQNSDVGVFTIPKYSCDFYARCQVETPYGDNELALECTKC